MANPAAVRYDLGWRRANLAAVIVLCLLAGAAMAWWLAAGRCWFGQQIPVDPGRVAAASEKVDPNTAPPASLRRLKMLGPKRVEEIIQYRQARQSRGVTAFKTIEDLDKVKGLGMDTIRYFQAHLSLPLKDEQ